MASLIQYNRSSNLSFTTASFFTFFGIAAIQFHSVIFEYKGFVGPQFTALLLTGSVAGIISQSSMAFVARFFQRPTTPLRFLLFLAALTAVLIPHLNSFAMMLATYFLHSFSVWGIFPLHTASGMEVYRDRGYGVIFLIRSLGTFGFMVGCILSAFFVERIGFRWLYAGFGAAYAVSLLAIMSLSRSYITAKTDTSSIPPQHIGLVSSWKSVFLQLKTSLLVRLLIPIGMISCANNMAINVQGNYILHNFSGTNSAISLPWAISSGFEIPIMFLCVYVLKKWNLTSVLALGLLGTCIRLAGMSLSTELWQLLLSITLHGTYYAGIVTGLTIAIDRTQFKHRASLQLLCSLIYSGVPNILGSFLAGYLWDHFSLVFVYRTSMAISLVALLFFLPLIPKLNKKYA